MNKEIKKEKMLKLLTLGSFTYAQLFLGLTSQNAARAGEEASQSWNRTQHWLKTGSLTKLLIIAPKRGSQGYFKCCLLPRTGICSTWNYRSLLFAVAFHQ